MLSQIDTRNELLRSWAQEFNSLKYFQEDPIVFPKRFLGGCLQDVEIAAIFACHLAWGRRSMIVRDLERLFGEMGSSPYIYIIEGEYRRGAESCHRTISWDEIAGICGRLREFYAAGHNSLECMSPDDLRVHIFGQKSDLSAANKKIHMMRRWMVRDDGIVDLGLWKEIDKRDLVIPLDVHVWTQASALGLVTRRSKDFKAAREITDNLLEVFPDDPLLGDFALFGYGVTGGAPVALGAGGAPVNLEDDSHAGL